MALAAFMSMPHQRSGTLSAGLALGGLSGLVYSCAIGINMWRIGVSSTAYIPVREDWIWNVILPTVVYAALIVMAVLLWDRLTEAALYGVAVLALALLFISIRNAWDIAVWMTMSHDDKPQDSGE
jgi:hypothetical protein